MEKIIYNTKLKKLVIATLIAMLIFNFIVPITINLVYAYEFNMKMLYPDGPSGTRVAPEDLPNANDTNWKQEDWLLKDYQKDAFLSANVTNYNPDLSFSTNADNNAEVASAMLVFDEYDKSIKESYQHNQNPANQSNKITLAQALRTAIDGSIASGNELENKYDPDEEDEATLGGILLSPIFYLVNFVADAITSNLGRIMVGDGLSLTSGFKVLQGDAIPPSSEGSTEGYHQVDTSSFGLSLQYPNIKYTPEEIFSGQIELLSIDFISGTNYEGNKNSDEGWQKIRTVISQWYQVLRMVAIIGLLSVLIYTGIKIIISANAKDKAKYKEWIINWFMAVAILFAMHIIMAFIISVTGELSKLITEASSVINVQPSTGDAFSTNLMGLVRFMIQSENFAIKVGYEVMYIALIVYTIKFTVVYLKRVLNMAFLTLIAPIVALTYPIDKINDGRAQGFDMWLKEYIFNALLQPMHCILYYILVGSAVSISASNPIYGIVVLMFMTEAEKLLKKIFGFDKAGGGTVGGMANAFAAGAVASSISKMMKLPKGNAGKGGNAGAGNGVIEGVKPTEKPGMDVFGGDVGPGTIIEDSNENRDNSDSSNSNRNDREATPQQRMLDAYDENYGTDEYNSAEREAMAREAYQPEGMDLDEEQQRQYFREQGRSEEEIDEIIPRTANNSEPEQTENQRETSNEAQEDSAEGTPDVEPTADQEQSQNSVREMAEKLRNSKQFKGAKAVGKRLMKPVYDTDKSWQYNLKRAGKGAVRAGVGVALGTAAAAVQAGISITDGKYNALEGAASFTAGYAGGGQITRGFGSLYDTYQEGTLSDNPSDRKKEIMARAQKTFGDRDDVIAFNKKNYPGQEKEVMQRQRDHYLTAGITDLKEMKSGIKYADSLVGKTDGLTAEQIKAKREAADRKAAATIDFRKTLKDQGQLSSVYDKDKQDKYIQSMVDKAAQADKEKVRKQYENAFKSVIAYDAANG